MKKLIFIISMSVSLNVFAVVGDQSDGLYPNLLADPTDTKAATIKVCNFYQTPVVWNITSNGDPVVIGGRQRLDINSCALIGLRAKTGSEMPTLKVTTKGIETPVNLNVSFTLTEYRQATVSLTPKITKYIKTLDLKDAGLINAYTPKNGYSVEAISNGLQIQNLSGGLNPDFVLCVGGSRDTCNDTFGMN
jgi:hypothetical protein